MESILGMFHEGHVPRSYPDRRTSLRESVGRADLDALVAALSPPRNHAKKTAHASRQDRAGILEQRWTGFDDQLDLEAERLVFIDEA